MNALFLEIPALPDLLSPTHRTPEHLVSKCKEERQFVSEKRTSSFQDERTTHTCRRDIIDGLKKQKLELQKQVNVQQKLKQRRPCVVRPGRLNERGQNSTSSIKAVQASNRRDHRAPMDDEKRNARGSHSEETTQSSSQTRLLIPGSVVGAAAFHWDVNMKKLLERCPKLTNFCTVLKKGTFQLRDPKFASPCARDGLDGIMQLVVHGKKCFYDWLTDSKMALRAIQMASLLQVKNFDAIISDRVNHEFFGEWDPQNSPAHFVEIVEIVEFFSWYFPILRHNLCDWLIFHYDYQSTVYKAHAPEFYCTDWLGRLPESFVRELCCRSTRQFGIENVVFELVLEWARQRFSIGNGNSRTFPTVEAKLMSFLSSNDYFLVWREGQRKILGNPDRGVNDPPYLRTVLDSLEAENKYRSTSSRCKLACSVLTIENRVVSEFNPFLQRGRIVSSNLAIEYAARMRCAADVDGSILYGLDSSDGKLYKLDLGKVCHSQSGTCQWTAIDECTFANRLKFSDCEGIAYSRRKDQVYVCYTRLVDRNRPQLYLSIFDCKDGFFTSDKQIILNLEGVEDWLPDVFFFDERCQQLLVGGASKKGNRTLFISIDVENFTGSELASVHGVLTMGTLTAHPETNHLYYVGGSFEDRERLPTSNRQPPPRKNSFAYYEMGADRCEWKRFEVKMDSEEGSILTPLCTFPKPYNFIRIHACEFSSGRRFPEQQLIDFPISGRDDEARRATVRDDSSSSSRSSRWFQPWKPLDFKKQQMEPVSFCGLLSRKSSSSGGDRAHGSETPLRDESSSGHPYRTHVLMPVRSIAKWWHSCTEIDTEHNSSLCIVCRSTKL